MTKVKKLYNLDLIHAVTDLRSTMHKQTDDSFERLYGLIGKPLGHSFSAGWFTKLFAEQGLSACYRNFELDDISELEALLRDNDNLAGLNVTSPYKQAVIPWLDRLDASAEAVNAVNVIHFDKDGNGKRLLTGYNTDIAGFRKAVTPFLTPEISKALVLGTGGAASAAVFVLRESGLEVTQVSRSPKQGQISYDDINADVMNTHPLIVNSTPLGMGRHEGQAPNLPYNLFTDKHLAFDMVYNPAVTEFMRLAAKNGAKTQNGLAMLIGQAEAAAEIWRIKE